MRRLRTKAGAVAVVASAAMLLAACGGGSSSDSSSGSGSGGSLDIYIGAQPNFPEQFATWSKAITDTFKAKTGADLTIETYASASDETTKIQSSVVAGSGPDIYNLGTTFTPVAYATQGFLTLSEDDGRRSGAVNGSCRRRWECPDPTRPTRSVSRQPCDRSVLRTTPTCSP